MRHAMRGVLLGLGLLALAPAAFAHTDVYVGIGLDGYAVPPPVYYAPPPPPVYYAAPPVVYGYRYDGWHRHHRDWDDERWHGEHEGHGWRHHHGHDDDDD